MDGRTDGWEERDTEREMSERNMDQPDQLLPLCAPTGAQTCNRGKCPDRDLNL